MKILVYENTFQCFLTAIYEAFYSIEKPAKIISKFDYLRDFQLQLDTEVVEISVNQEKADKVYNAVLKKISAGTLSNLYYLFLSSDFDKGILAFYYLKFAFKKGRYTDNYLVDENVKPVHDIVWKVKQEKHRMKGLLRFKLLDNGIYYAAFEPDHDITELIAPHFSRRLGDQFWIIHDLKRLKAALYNKEEWIISDLTEKELPPLSAKEIEIQEIWKKYFKHISIKERKNNKLQKSFMPVRYWKHLVEKEE